MQTRKTDWFGTTVMATLVLVGIGVKAEAALTSASDSHVSFEGKGPAGFKIAGATSDLTVAESDGNIVITVPLANLNTGIDLRDHHMKEKYLEVPKYPAATLTVPRDGLRVPAPGERSEADTHGMLTLHGVTRPITLHYDAKSEAGAVVTHGKFHINMNDFGINVPSYLGVTVKPDIDVAASFRAN